MHEKPRQVEPQSSNSAVGAADLAGDSHTVVNDERLRHSLRPTGLFRAAANTIDVPGRNDERLRDPRCPTVVFGFAANTEETQMEDDGAGTNHERGRSHTTKEQSSFARRLRPRQAIDQAPQDTYPPSRPARKRKRVEYDEDVGSSKLLYQPKPAAIPRPHKRSRPDIGAHQNDLAAILGCTTTPATLSKAKPPQRRMRPSGRTDKNAEVAPAAASQTQVRDGRSANVDHPVVRRSLRISERRGTDKSSHYDRDPPLIEGKSQSHTTRSEYTIDRED